MNKIEALDHQLDKAKKRVEDLRRDLGYAERSITSIEGHLRHANSETPVRAAGPTFCDTCGADVSTERLFSLHYVIPDYRYANLGNCPHR